MRLLDQKSLNREKIREQSAEIDRGLKLAKRVDELRSVKVKEEKQIEAFRTKTLEIVKNEIHEAIRERDNERALAEKERIARLKAAKEFSVLEEIERVNREKEQIKKAEKDLLDRETLVIERESATHEKELSLEQRIVELDGKEILADEYLEKKKIEYDKAAIASAEAKRRKDESEQEIRHRYDELAGKEEELSLIEMNVRNRELALIQTQREIEKEKMHIESQQKALKAAWDRIRRLQASK